MILKFGGPYHGYRNGQVVEFSDEEGQRLLDAMGGPPYVEVVGEIPASAPAPVVVDEPDVPEVDEDPYEVIAEQIADDDAELLAEIAAEEAAAADEG